MNEPTQACATPPACDGLTVMFDGSCPLCRREVGVYQSLTALSPVAWQDVSQATQDMTPELQALYMARFHVQKESGELLSGAAAFVALWQVMPGWRWLGRLGALPGMTAVLEVFYKGFLRIRPRIQRLVRGLDGAPPPKP
jgi:predicted DCC family thiol-disulfide oxidoreductase YuxK